MWVRNETSDSAEDCERFDFQMRRSRFDVGFVERDERVVLLVDIQVFDETFTEKVVESDVALLQLENVVGVHPWLAVLHDDSRSTDTPTITGDMHRPLVVIGVYTDKFVEPTRSSKLAELRDEFEGGAADTDDSSIDVDDVGVRAIDFRPSGQADICKHLSHLFNH